VVFLAPKVKRLHLVVRAPGLEASMSRYLIDRIAALSNVELHTNTDVLALEGDEATGLTAAVFRDRTTGTTPHVCAATPFPVHRCGPEHWVVEPLRRLGR
jgi:thioredoxin reductase (NADPH)